MLEDRVEPLCLRGHAYHRIGQKRQDDWMSGYLEAFHRVCNVNKSMVDVSGAGLAARGNLGPRYKVTLNQNSTSSRFHVFGNEPSPGGH